VSIRQGLIPAAGSGSRLGPFTNAIPKELLPIGENAVIEHVVESIRIAGITDIVIVISPHKHGISDYLGSGSASVFTLPTLFRTSGWGLQMLSPPVNMSSMTPSPLS